MTRTTEEVFLDHLALAQAQDVETDIGRNFATDCVLMTSYGTFRGHDGVRDAARLLEEQIGRTPYHYHRQEWHAELAFLEWSATSETATVDDGADSFWITGGMIQAMTIHYTVRST